jgi:hypothetical protein
MQQVGRLILGLVLAATGAQGFIQLIIGHNAGALRWLPGGFVAHLAGYALIFVSGLTMARRNRVRPDPEHDHRR